MLKAKEKEAIERCKDEDVFMLKYGDRGRKTIIAGSIEKIKNHLFNSDLKKWYNFDLYEIKKENGDYTKKKYTLGVQELMYLAMKRISSK
jgi:hypothetical protein